MSKKIAHDIEDAQFEMYKAVKKALDEFTDKTGCVVNRLDWNAGLALDANGHTEEVEYWGFGSTISTGMSGNS